MLGLDSGKIILSLSKHLGPEKNLLVRVTMLPTEGLELSPPLTSLKKKNISHSWVISSP
jgi:hypothetical protein